MKRTIASTIGRPVERRAAAASGSPRSSAWPWLLLPAAGARCTTSRGTSRTQASDFFDDGTSARPLVAGTVPRRDPRERGQASAELFDDRQDRGQARRDAPVPGGSLGPRARPGALPDLLHPLPRRAGRRPGHDRPPRLQPASAVFTATSCARSRSAISST